MLTFHDLRNITDERFKELENKITFNTTMLETTNESKYEHRINYLLKTIAINYALYKLACYKTLSTPKIDIHNEQIQGAINEVFNQINISYSLPTNISHIFH